MPVTHSSRVRSTSVSSMRRMNVPPACLAKSQLKSAVRAPPTWRKPVGDGAKRTRGADTRRGYLPPVTSLIDGEDARAHAPERELPRVVPGRRGQGRDGGERSGAGHDGHPPVRL